MGKHSKSAEEEKPSNFIHYNIVLRTRKQRMWVAFRPYLIWITLYLGLAILGLVVLLIHPEYPPCKL